MADPTFKPLSRTEEILFSIINETDYTLPPLSRIEGLLIQLKQAFHDHWGW